MASTILTDASPKRVPREFVTSEHCISFPAGNTHTFSNGVTIYEGDEMVFDLVGVPKHGDLVLMHSDGKPPFVRCCEIAPASQAPRDQWCMGVLDADGESIVMIDMRKFDRIGVCTGIDSADGWRLPSNMLSELQP